ncbi:MAG: chromosome segregation protein SMC [Elusimicrobia bacterium RIFCSPHIGHO2_02_FULL_57_9]|nr:MAG: chromosome segregation protein SMC [Elusimicrobia bacterium RIFCSPHIGHO2_02_FULL_57_9]
MHLKSIDIVGYKSFANKTHLDLEPGITGIIGPNGCGKSNIMECVRWCLGEMSWKSLRADSMLEVIFAGTAKRPPMSMTEVTLTFDNASNMLPVQFSEVTVSRRIFRSGESAYFLNKTQCRLRDIREMFLDTGLGGDGYAIIDQGGVDFVLTSKPEDRRAIFEEAAGVAKYKAKREEALRKLERVEADMGRLQDSVVLISDQVKKLDSDARKAKLYKKYKEDLAVLEAAQILQQASLMEGELQLLAGSSRPLEETLGARRVEISAEGANLSALNLEKANQQNQLLGCNQKIAEVKSQAARLEERIQSSERFLLETAERLKACEEERQAARRRLAGIDPEIEQASLAVVSAQALRAAAEQEALGWDGQLETLKRKLAESQAALETLKAEVLAAAQAALGRRRKMAEADSAYCRQEAQVRSCLRELEKDLVQVGKVQGEIEASRAALTRQEAQTETARGRAQEAQAALEALRRHHQEMARETLRLHSELAHAQAKVESLEAQAGQNPYWAGAQAVLNAGIEGVVGTVRQLVKIEENYKPYLEDVLGERLYAIVCEHSSAARAAVELLEASGKGRARFLILSALPSFLTDKNYPDDAKPLMRHMQFAPQYEKAVRFLFQDSYALDKTLFGDCWVYGGSSRREQAQLSFADAGEIRARAAACQTRCGELEAAGSRCELETADRENRSRLAVDVVNQQSAIIHALKAQIDEKEAGLSVYVRNVELSTAEAADLLSEMALTRERILILREEIEQTEAREKIVREREIQASESLGVFKEELAKGQATEELLKSKLHNLEDKTNFLAGNYERLCDEKKNQEAALSRRAQEIEELIRKSEENRLLGGQSRQELEKLNAQLAVFENEARVVLEGLRAREQSIAEKEQTLRGIKAAADGAQEQLHQIEVKASALRSTRDGLKKRLWDDWQLSFEQARAKYEGQTVEAEKIDFLRKRISTLGNINMAAPEEYEALSSKQAFLAGQINDLNQAKEDLKNAISKINGATRENFRQTFTEVREHFRRIYGVLFEGGEADLILTDPENILETGVDIVAQPPGKRLQNLSLLSGGEKTLTAIALLFAFFMVKPSPFCMLDEADAALDDANVERFIALLREFHARTQFLIVSHNKRTMEAADVIYGVTMEEMGISQLISVDFRKKLPDAAPTASKEVAEKL